LFSSTHRFVYIEAVVCLVATGNGCSWY